MNRKIIRPVGILIAVLVATAVLTMGISWVRASETTLATAATNAQVDSSFTYQGSLDNNGTAVNGNCDFQFDLYDASSGGTQVGSMVTKSNVAVSDGLFTVTLDFGNEFRGDERFLEISVRCPAGSGGYTLLNGRVALTATPYALSLRPGAIIEGAVATSSTLQSINSNSSGTAYGLYGQTDSDDFFAAGVYGRATANTGFPIGVSGEASSNEGTGVFGYAIATSGKNVGVYGQTMSNQGVGVFADGIMTGTYSIASNNSGQTVGVVGEVNSLEGVGVVGLGLNQGVEGYASAFTGPGNGVYGHNESSSGIGVQGNAAALTGSTTGVFGAAVSPEGTGVFGSAQAITGTNYGVYGSTSSPFGYAIYAQGRTYIEGELNWKPITSYVSISAGDFQPVNSSTAYNGTGDWLQNSSGSSAEFIASVQLPHQAQISNFTFYWSDISLANDGSAAFIRNNLNQTGNLLMSVNTSGVGGNGSSNNTASIPIDNSQFAYYVVVTLPDANVEINGIVIEYTIDQPH